MTSRPRRRWTVLLYMMADVKNLEKYAYAALQEISDCQPSSDIKFLAELTLPSQYIPRIRRYDFHGDQTDGLRIDKNGHRYYPVSFSKRPGTRLVNFFKWGVLAYPAERYFFILWGHAWGVDYAIPPTSLARQRTLSALRKETRLILGSPRSKNHLSNRELQKAIAKASTLAEISIVGMDACVMSMVEVCYDLRDSTKYTLASEGLDPLGGWPYGEIVRSLVQNPRIEPASLADKIITTFVRNYSKWHKPFHKTIAFCSLAYASELASAMRVLSAEMILALKDMRLRAAIIHSRVQAVSEDMPTYIDICSFCRVLRSQPQLKHSIALKQACQKVEQIVHGQFVIQAGLRGSKGKSSRGLSIYFPNWILRGKREAVFDKSRGISYRSPYGLPLTLGQATQKIAAAYTTHDFARATGWMRFLFAFLAARDQSGHSQL
jgi:Clostripain family